MKLKTHFFHSDQLQSLLDALRNKGYDCIGPQVRDGAIIFDEINSVSQLPRGIHDEQAAGYYSLNKSRSSHFFDWANGPQAIKPLLFSAKENLWQTSQSSGGQLSFNNILPESRPLAIIGVRACDIAAMKIQDQHFLQQQFVDPYYKERRNNLLTIAVNCSHPADTCFCHSTGDGPFTEEGADIVLTELQNGFLIQAQSSKGKQILEGLSLEDGNNEHINESEKIRQKASRQNKQLPAFNIRSRLFEELKNEAWHSIAARCLSCGNCTAVCPTCFCHSEQDAPTLDGLASTHFRQWDSCFSQGHSYIHGITIRSETSQRYRQWLTHKFSSWYEQYDRSGCVGCGRCISWCPVGIDVTESISQVIGHDPGSGNGEKND